MPANQVERLTQAGPTDDNSTAFSLSQEADEEISKKVMPERNTRQKTAVVEVLEKSRTPLAAPQILAAAQQIVPSISQATVYRILKALLEKDTIATVKLPGEVPLYELAGKSHHHYFRCRQCGFMYEVSGCMKLLKGLVPRGFRLEDHEMFLFGTCSACAGGK
jgi:Fur family ferric uptake transcriptional regulator